MVNGFVNEDEIKLSINNKMFVNLSSNMQNLIKASFRDYDRLISCKKIAGASKSDLVIRIGAESHTFSIKKGTGNSVHQEPIEFFLNYLNMHDVDQKIKDNLRFYIWGDGTLDGSGSISDRMNAHQLSQNYPDIVSSINIYLNEIKKPLIKRFMADGKDAIHPAEYIYYGSKVEGIFCEMDKAMDWLCNQESIAKISVGKLTFQAWNRNINGGYRSEDKRGVIQIKWGTLRKDLEVISNE